MQKTVLEISLCLEMGLEKNKSTDEISEASFLEDDFCLNQITKIPTREKISLTLCLLVWGGGEEEENSI